MAPAYKLTYFPVTALGEPIRFLFSYGGIDFEDSRFKIENWPELKPKMPFGQVPVLEHNGKLVHQSIAISRYVAKQVKLAGKNDWEDLEIDAMVDTINDLRAQLAKFHYEQDEYIKNKVKEPLFKETLPFYLTRLENIAKKNKGYLVLGRLTWADVFFVSMISYFNVMAQTNVIAAYPTLAALEKNILAIPTIQKYIEKRPKTDY